MFFVLGVSGFSTVSGAVENACFPTMGNVYCTKNGVFDGPRNGRKSGNAQNKKHCNLANGRALPNTSGGTPFSWCTCPNTAHKIRTIQTLHTNALPIRARSGCGRGTVFGLQVYCALINFWTVCVHILYECKNVQMYTFYSVQSTGCTVYSVYTVYTVYSVQGTGISYCVINWTQQQTTRIQLYAGSAHTNAPFDTINLHNSSLSFHSA